MDRRRLKHGFAIAGAAIAGAAVVAAVLYALWVLVVALLWEVVEV